MVTVLLIFLLMLVIGFALAILTGLVAIFPVTLSILAFIALDVILFKWIFKRKK